MSAQRQQERTSIDVQLARIFSAGLFAYVLIRAGLEFYGIAWGTGVWLGEFSLKWGLALLGFVLLCVLAWCGSVLILWKGPLPDGFSGRLVALRRDMKAFRWFLVLTLLVLPVWFLQFTPWGVVFSGLYFRLMLWIFIVLGLAVFLKADERLVSWSTLIAALVLTSGVYSFAYAFIQVSDYPFSLSWSEGNRLWDYSLFFGRHLYDYPPDGDIFATTDAGRQLVGGLPFLFTGVSIVAERSWVALTTVLPYLLLGFAAFRFAARDKTLWLLLGIWAFIFLKQGPIHPPLVLCAFVVALLWRGPLWISIPLVVVTSYLAEQSRYTWMFAPALWLVMLEFSGIATRGGRLGNRIWWRAAVLGLAGAFGGYYGSVLLGWFRGVVETLAAGGAAPAAAAPTAPSVSLASVTSSMTAHPLLWYRLFPNATYGMGILLALMVAVAPLVTLLIYLSVSRRWVLNSWQKVALLLPLIAFLVVGLVVSTKIGGGGDLHNMDMFLIGVFFTAVIAWENGGRSWLRQIDAAPVLVKAVTVILLVIPGIQPLSGLRSYLFAEEVPWLMTLTGVTDAKYLEMLPARAEIVEILGTIQGEVELAKPHGEILFMDQRQLLTFGYVEDVPLVPEYEKKVLMNAAMGSNERYFRKLYADLAAKRFSLIISEPLRAPVKDSSYQFGEENNAWVRWVVEPVLCYYEPIETFKSAQIQLLVPKQGAPDCTLELPVTLEPQD